MIGGSNKTLEYFQPLGRERMQKLYQIFRIDFEMFDYSIDSYEELFLWLCYYKLTNLVKPKQPAMILSHHAYISIGRKTDSKATVALLSVEDRKLKEDLQKIFTNDFPPIMEDELQLSREAKYALFHTNFILAEARRLGAYADWGKS